MALIDLYSTCAYAYYFWQESMYMYRKAYRSHSLNVRLIIRCAL